jgi:yecA family protein
MHENLSLSNFSDLETFLTDSRRPDGTLCFQELQGFLFAVACSPELVPPSAWQPVISNDEDIDFQSESEAELVLSLILTLYNKVNVDAMERSDRMPMDCKIAADIEANFNEDSAISQWSNGFMIGHDWLEEVWDEYLPEELDREFGSCSMVLSFFSSRKLAELYYLESTTTPRRRKPRIPFDEFAESVRDLIPSALSMYAHIGRTIAEVSVRSDQPEH